MILILCEYFLLLQHVIQKVPLNNCVASFSNMTYDQTRLLRNKCWGSGVPVKGTNHRFISFESDNIAGKSLYSFHAVDDVITLQPSETNTSLTSMNAWCPL